MDIAKYLLKSLKTLVRSMSEKKSLTVLKPHDKTFMSSVENPGEEVNLNNETLPSPAATNLQYLIL